MVPYVVFALKWRPQNFDDIVGQGHIVGNLRDAIHKNRIPHAYLFAGPRGVGKTSTARILAKALNCKDGPTTNPCGKCSSCLEVTQGRSLDVIEIDGASNRGIDEIRTLRENVKFSPVNGKFKIYIIDEVHMLTTEAFNALLKTLEEPPEFVKFIFATTQPNKVIPTILSRCQRFDFRRIPVIEMIKQLEKIAKKENINVDEDVLFSIAKSSDGSLRDAESVLDQLNSFSKDKISLEDVISLLGLVEQDVLFAMAEAIIQKDTNKALVLLNNIIDTGKDIGVFLNKFIEHFRNLMVAKITQADPELVDMPGEICQKLLRQSQAFSLEEIFSAFNILVNTQEMSKRLDSLRIPLEISLIKLTHDKRELNSPRQPPQNPAPQVREPHSAEQQIPPKESEEVAQASLEEVKNSWQDIIAVLGKIKMSVATYMNEASPIKLVNNVLTLSLPKNCSLHKESLERKENKAVIEKTLSETLNAQIRIDFVLSQEISEQQNTQDNSFIRSALEAFKGRVIKEG